MRRRWFLLVDLRVSPARRLGLLVLGSWFASRNSRLIPVSAWLLVHTQVVGTSRDEDWMKEDGSYHQHQHPMEEI